jgi:DNA-binding transcriptional regulator YiaG
MKANLSPLTEEEETELFSSYDSLMQIAKKPLDMADERYLYHSLEGKVMKENEEKSFEDELPPSLFEVERRLTGKINNEESCLSIHALRQARHISQEQLANHLHIEPEYISQLEQNTDRVLRTLCCYIEAMGGQLDIIAHFPDGEVRIQPRI